MHLRQRLWNPYALVFLSSSCVMVIELVASRLIAPRVGVSLYTWTSVIGVILAGVSIGNYVGGRLADKRASQPLLGIIFALASLASLSILWLNNDLHSVSAPAHVPFIVWVILYIAGVFLLPSLLLGCISPIIVKLSVTSLQHTGRTVGKIYAWSSVGSIAGTFATGFWLISAFGTKTTVIGVASVLMLLALWYLSAARPRRAIVSVVLALAMFGGGIALLQRSGYLASECRSETNYFCINVYAKNDEGNIRELILDRLVHSYSDMNDPTNLLYDYEQTYAALIRPLMTERQNLSAVFIGGGGYTFPRYMEAIRPDSRLLVAEIDPGVTETAYAVLGLDRDSDIVTENVDARMLLSDLDDPGSYDLVFGDAFNDYSVPYHLTTLEFDRLVDRALHPDGLYLVNIIDGGERGSFFRAYVTTLRQVFEHVTVIPSKSDWRGAARTTFIIAAAHEPIDLSHLPDKYTPLSAKELADYIALEPVVILTDDYVPVDNLLAPVIDDSFQLGALDEDISRRIMTRVYAIGGALVAAALAGAVFLLRRRAQRPAAV